MGCFFGCFRIRDDRRRPHFVSNSASTPSKPTEAAVSKNRLSSLFLTEEGEESTYNDMENLYVGSQQINKGLVDEAKFLKACGTLPETPAEIRKASDELKGLPPFDNDSKSSDFHSWLLNTPTNKLQLDKPSTPIKLCKELRNDSASPGLTPSSCISNVQNTGRISVSSIEDGEAGNVKTAKVHVSKNDDITPSVSQRLSDTNVPCKNRSVRFECSLDTSSSKGYESPGDLSVSKRSPKPTPLKLSDEMQTPGTVFPANLEVVANGKARIRSQYVYSVLNPVENVSQWKVIQEDDFISHQLENQTPKSELGAEQDSSVQELKAEASLSSWIKPPQSVHDADDANASSKNFRLGRTPTDRPIIGMVAAHWNENEPSHISPRWWDGNGIPNSTNKYKEDQKVSWHATPFEERLEKALSEESFISQKKHIDGRPIVFDEQDESDTALSTMKPSTYSKPVILC
ncbi:hypothetical protein JCGZ_08897 [Jatropha curcas]|uniref:Protein JASON n=2 Tax=Jatropha curcas TaxID=180498 RepID=A0A067KXD5_JATCU|nr:hypothetical protein JCGZ_08897 [Jatropha curcas]